LIHEAAESQDKIKSELKTKSEEVDTLNLSLKKNMEKQDDLQKNNELLKEDAEEVDRKF
jgi:hypothetical protein